MNAIKESNCGNLVLANWRKGNTTLISTHKMDKKFNFLSMIHPPG